jgi:hypothetical protein
VFWVTASDYRKGKFLDNGKQQKIIVEIEKESSIPIIQAFFRKTKGFTYINVCTKKPHYRPEGFEVRTLSYNQFMEQSSITTR